ncbi:MAG TPA: aspartyl protease family protein [Caulobacteraceae bacterium]|nr:aspartyl protease family protein [Caulobacteraceae bacterium]
MKPRSNLFPLLAAAFALLGFPAQAGCNLQKLPDLPVTMKGPRAIVPAKVNGANGLFIIDTGAFFSSMSPALVEKDKVKLGASEFGLTVSGVGRGDAQYAVATAQNFVFDGQSSHYNEFIVLQDTPGDSQDGSIGQNILGAFDVEYDFANGAIRLFHPSGCRDADLAYWDASQTDSVVDIASDRPLQPAMASASINGVKIHVLFDTGSPRSILSLSAAARAGIRPSDPGVTSSGYTSGVARRSQFRIWTGRFASFKIGGEEIKNTPLQFGDIDLSGADMLLGADFFLSHRILVSNSQHKIYFTYNGGPVFNLDTAPERTIAAAGSSAAVDSDGPRDAAGYARRAAARVSRRELADAIADLTQAIALAPADPDYLYERGRAEIANRQPSLGLADFAAVLKLKPDHVPTLVARAYVYWAARQPDQAKADLAAAAGFAQKYPDNRLAIGAAYVGIHLYRDAIPQLDQWIAAHPVDGHRAAAFNERCRARAQLGAELDKALADCNAALKLEPGDPTMLDSRGLVLLRTGDLDKSIADYDAALRLRPNTAWSLYGRGLAKLRKGHAADGQADIAAAAAINPRLPDEARAIGLTP